MLFKRTILTKPNQLQFFILTLKYMDSLTLDHRADQMNWNWKCSLKCRRKRTISFISSSRRRYDVLIGGILFLICDSGLKVCLHLLTMLHFSSWHWIFDNYDDLKKQFKYFLTHFSGGMISEFPNSKIQVIRSKIALKITII